MRYYQAREITREGQPTGLYHYTAQHDGKVYPVGYCAQDCPGHPTAAEACEHYRQYKLDQARYDGEWAAWYPCVKCGCLTNKYGEVGHSRFALCDEHRDRSNIEVLYGPVEIIVAS